MYVPTAPMIAAAFELGEAVGELDLVRRGDTDTWRLETATGEYFVKGYWPDTGGQFTSGGLLDQLTMAMDFEQRAHSAGIDLAEPVAPVDPVAGWVTRVEDRLFRVYRWIASRPLSADDDISEWLGRTMAQVHQLQPLGRAGLPEWWRTALKPQADWEQWFTEADRLGKTWAPLAWERLPDITAVTARITAACDDAPDCVMTHGDFKTHNLLMTPNGPVLIDWDSVRVDSAALEAGRVAHIFAAGAPEGIQRVLTAYTEAGGDVSWAGDDLFLSVARKDLHSLFEHVQVALGIMSAPRWMTDPDQMITDLLRQEGSAAGS
ncbi:phosphotransferase enzyme family protein [Kribbella sp. NPDC050470]|uniref:phosphotransferase enzyme family protein n=1 Tax=unclassified Kribbella TaxID=2644121 RepID=UPI0037A2E322